MKKAYINPDMTMYAVNNINIIATSLVKTTDTAADPTKDAESKLFKFIGSDNSSDWDY